MKDFIKVLLGITYVICRLTFYVSIIILSILLYSQLETFDVIFTLLTGIPIAWATGQLVRAIYKLAFKS